MHTLAPQHGPALEALYQRMAPHHLAPLWEVLAALVTPTPQPGVVAHRWDYGSARGFLLEAGGLITAERAERRVLILENPAMAGQAAVTRSLYAGLQLVLPGEVAPCHRHVQSALRFVLEGAGAFTAVNGERAVMQAFDLVLTPNWMWHDHGNDSDQPMIWLDGLDIPTVLHFASSFAERLGQPAHPPTRAAGDTLARFGHNLRPLTGPAPVAAPGRPLFHYPYRVWRAALAALAASDPADPHLGHALEFIDPQTGGPVMATIAAFCQLIPAGTATRPLQRTDGLVLVGVEGEGTVHLGEVTLPLAPRDVVVVPSWMAYRLEAASGQDLVVFAYSDRAAQQALGLWREHRH